MRYHKFVKSVFFTVFFIASQSAFSQSTQDIINALTDSKMMRLTTKVASSTATPWGLLKSGAKDENDAWHFSASKNNQIASAVFVHDQKDWVLNDLNVLIFPGENACAKTYKALSKQFGEKLGRANAQDSGDENSGTFWQLKDHKEWGIWVAVVMGKNPKTQSDECAVKATLAFGADEYLSEDGDF
jgi:hypothetical protein